MASETTVRRAGKMTTRQLLTRRAFQLFGLCALLIAPVTMLALKSPWADAPDAGRESAASIESARAIRVIAQPIDQAGPEFLRQSYTGIVNPRRTSLLASKSIGRVEQVLVDIGDRVQAGQVLLQLDRETLQAERGSVAAGLRAAEFQYRELLQGPRKQDIEQASARVAELNATLNLRLANLERFDSLVTTSSISKQEFDEARFTVEASQAQLRLAQEALAMLREGTREEQISAAEANVQSLKAELARVDVRIEEQSIRAPYGGQIQSRLIDEGVVVSPGQSLLRIVESDELEVHVGLPPETIPRLNPSNLMVTIGEQQLAVSIERMAPAINESTRTVEVVLGVRPSSKNLVQMGSAVKVLISSPVEKNASGAVDDYDPKQRGFWIPSEALTSAARGLWAVNIVVAAEDIGDSNGDETEYIVERRQVELLRSQGAWSQVRGPLDSQDLLVISGVHRISPGQRVVLGIAQRSRETTATD